MRHFLSALFGLVVLATGLSYVATIQGSTSQTRTSPTSAQNIPVDMHIRGAAGVYLLGHDCKPDADDCIYKTGDSVGDYGRYSYLDYFLPNHIDSFRAFKNAEPHRIIHMDLSNPVADGGGTVGVFPICGTDTGDIGSDVVVGSPLTDSVNLPTDMIVPTSLTAARTTVLVNAAEFTEDCQTVTGEFVATTLVFGGSASRHTSKVKGLDKTTKIYLTRDTCRQWTINIPEGSIGRRAVTELNAKNPDQGLYYFSGEIVLTVPTGTGTPPCPGS